MEIKGFFFSIIRRVQIEDGSASSLRDSLLGSLLNLRLFWSTETRSPESERNSNKGCCHQAIFELLS